LAAIEDTDAAALRECLCRSPEKVVVEFLCRWFLEAEHLAAGWINALQNGTNRTVLSCGIHSLEYQEQRVSVRCIKCLLQIIQFADSILKSLFITQAFAAAGWRVFDRKAAVKWYEVFGLWGFEHSWFRRFKLIRLARTALVLLQRPLYVIVDQLRISILLFPQSVYDLPTMFGIA